MSDNNENETLVCSECGSDFHYLQEVCPNCEQNRADEEPQEDDYTTTDYCKFYQCGKLVLDLDENDDYSLYVRAHMETEQYWPNVWFISDHGNAHLLSL